MARSRATPRPRHGCYAFRGFLAACAGLAFSACERSHVSNEEPPSPSPASQTADPAIRRQLAEARYQIAREKIARHDPAEALLECLAALDADPTFDGPMRTASQLLVETRWSFPETVLTPGLPVEQLVFASAETLWIALSAEWNMTFSWDLETRAVGGILFPIRQATTRTLLASPAGSAMLIERDGIVHWVDAATFKPIRQLASLPDGAPASSTIAFSADGLLFAQATPASPAGETEWQIRDAATGEIVRSASLSAQPPAVAAHLDRQRLSVLLADETLIIVPLSPLEAMRETSPASQIRLSQAFFNEAGDALVTLEHRGEQEPPALSELLLGTRPADSVVHLRDRFSWNRVASPWTGFGPHSLFEVSEHRLLLHDAARAPLRSRFPITAAATRGERVAIGDAEGTVTLWRWLPALGEWREPSPRSLDGSLLSSLRALVHAATGLRRLDDGRYAELSPGERVEALAGCDASILRDAFPEIALGRFAEAMLSSPFFETPADAFDPLHQRLARARGESAEVAGFQQVLDNGTPQELEASLAAAGNLPPLVRKTALARLSWLHGDRAAALSGWPETPVDPDRRKREEDWNGWEALDLQAALHLFQSEIEEEISGVRLSSPEDADQRKAVIEKLRSPDTWAILGRPRAAAAALKAAHSLAAFPDHAAAALELAVRARQQGADAAACFRAEALALTTLGDRQEARTRWLTLLTDYPVEAHLPGDYAEAAYTSYENGDARQALEILIAGQHRYPDDTHFALRAGWVALLIDQPERALEFLLSGQRAGYPEEKRETALTLLAATESRLGDELAAAAYFRDLIDLDAAWLDPRTIDSLEWPADLKKNLREIRW